jgi:Lon protease-like protein
MARKRKHDTAAECVAAHRERRADTHRRVEVFLPIDAAEKLKRIATDEATTPSAIVEKLIATLPDAPA